MINFNNYELSLIILEQLLKKDYVKIGLVLMVNLVNLKSVVLQI